MATKKTGQTRSRGSQTSRKQAGTGSRTRTAGAKASGGKSGSSSKRRSSGSTGVRSAGAGSTGKAAHPLTDHDEIRRWAEERGAVPSRVLGTGGGEDPGMIRLDFPGYSGEESLEEIGWDDWFEKFDENGLALMVQDIASDGQKSNFNKLVKRTTAEQQQQKTRTARG
jgi:hypothetical protein